MVTTPRSRLSRPSARRAAPRPRLRAALLAALVATLPTACAKRAEQAAPVILATTTSTYDSGLLDDLIPPFEWSTGTPVKTIAVGTGKALALGERGEADLLLVHAPEAEEALMARGAGLLRRRMMYNDFILAGPAADPAGVRRAKDIGGALGALVRSGATFVSRGDDSGTDKIERALWSRLGLHPARERYLETGQGMGATLRVASEKQAYTLSDRGTYLALRESLRLAVLFEGDEALKNVYHLIVVNPKQGPRVNVQGAEALARYLLSEKCLARVREFGRARFGQPLFVPDPEPFEGAGSDASRH
jgi:tungstate transport system substrate-binding protein